MMRYEDITKEIKKLADVLHDRVSVANSEEDIEKAFKAFYKEIMTNSELRCDNIATVIGSSIEKKVESKEFSYEYGKPCIVEELRSGNKLRVTIENGEYIVDLLSGDRVISTGRTGYIFQIAKVIREVCTENEGGYEEDIEK